jgi:hypothetical protein
VSNSSLLKCFTDRGRLGRLQILAPACDALPDAEIRPSKERVLEDTVSATAVRKHQDLERRTSHIADGAPTRLAVDP